MQTCNKIFNFAKNVKHSIFDEKYKNTSYKFRNIQSKTSEISSILCRFISKIFSPKVFIYKPSGFKTIFVKKKIILRFLYSE